MEEKTNDEDLPKISIPKSSSFSPKITRPKLPSFSSGRSTSPRAKTDPGRGDIKSIMEDIMNLNKVDFPKTYGRPRMRSSPGHGKSQSTNSSPSASPSLGDIHSGDEQASAFSRNRSRSLKQLTNKLKSGKYASDNQQTNIPEGSEQADPIPDVNITDTDALSRESSPPQTACHAAVGKEQTGNRSKESSPVLEQLQMSADRDSEAVPSECGSEPHRQESIDSLDHEQTPDSDATDEHSSEIKTSHEYLTLNMDRQAEDEGVEEGDAPSPIVSTFTYHPIGRNSPFLKLASTCPKRRTGITTLATLGRVQQLYGKGEDGKTEDSSGKRFQRRDGSQQKGTQKMSPVRFITHPPHRKASFREDGSMDSNGFGALKASSGDSDDEQKLSQLSLTDSQYCPSEGMEDSYQEVVESVVGDHSDSEKQDRKNGKSLKQKSKSDPSGDKTRDMGDFPKVSESSQSHSAPLLSKDDREASSEDDEKAESKPKSSSENILSSGSNVDESTANQGTDDDEVDQIESENSQLPSPSSAHSITVLSSSPSPTQDLPGSGSSEQHSEKLLSVPSPRKPILRSASSASVLTRKTYGSSSKDKDHIRKYSITTDEKQASLSPDFSPLGDSGLATSMPVVWKDRVGRSESPERDPSFIKDKRYHIVEELYRNEKEYVEALRTLKDKYMVPLKTQSSLDDAIVDNIFYMIPEILTHHSIYLDFLDNVWKHWDSATSTVGNIIITIFSKQTVLESYLSFVENYKTSGKVIENALSNKSSVQKFLENCQRDSGSKLSMKDLIVRPIQRIPRYELLIQRLLDNTPKDHPDYELLQHADKVMHDLAMKIGTLNENQSEEDMQQTLKKLELLLITDLAVPDRSYLRHDMVQILNKKDQCCMWFFSDLIIISSIKRKSGPVTRKVSIILKTPMGQDFAENIKHKVWLRVGLDDIEIVKNQGSLTRKPTIDRDQVEDDLALLSQLTDLANKLSCQHQNLDDVLKEMTTMLNKQLAECQARCSLPDSNKMEMLVTTQEGVLHLVIAFPSAEKRASWECLFSDAKHKLSLLSDKRAPEFLQPLQITKTRAGMQKKQYKITSKAARSQLFSLRGTAN